MSGCNMLLTTVIGASESACTTTETYYTKCYREVLHSSGLYALRNNSVSLDSFGQQLKTYLFRQ